MYTFYYINITNGHVTSHRKVIYIFIYYAAEVKRITLMSVCKFFSGKNNRSFRIFLKMLV